MSPRNRKRLWLAVKSLLAAVIVAGVARHFAAILGRAELGEQSFEVRPELLVPAGLLYLLAHCCWATFWVRLLRGQGVRATWYAGLRAYFVSQFGKYIPGKVSVILIRVAMLGSPGTRLAVGVTATYETLTSMASGALLGVLFLPYAGVLPPVVTENKVVVVVIAGLPIALGLLNKVAVRVAAKSRGPDVPPLPSPSPWLLGQGLLHGACGWCLLAVSLGLVTRAIVPGLPPWDVPGYLGDLAVVALAYVLGFVVLVAPGGLGVRELILQHALAARFAPLLGDSAAGTAVVVALVLRVVWTVAELGLAAVLWAWGTGESASRGT